MNELGTLDIFSFFIDNFHVSDIYEYGWYAAQEWTALIAGILIAIAVGIRYLEESTKSLSGKSDYLGAIWAAVGFSVLIGVYFGLAMAFIDLFNAIHNALGSNTSMAALGKKLDSVYSAVSSGEYDFAWADIMNSAIFLFAIMIYAITYGVLIFVTIALRIGHAMLVTFILFWGAVALPMSITNGVKMLSAFKTMAVTVFIWPIIEAFFIYVISGSFLEALDRSGLGGDNTTFNLGSLVYFTAIFSIMNLLLVATTVSAPLIAQSVANGTGNIAGMVGSFAAAGIAAGVAAGKLTGSKAQQTFKAGAGGARDILNTTGTKLNAGKNPISFSAQQPKMQTGGTSKAFSDNHVTNALEGFNSQKDSKGYSFGDNNSSKTSTNSNSTNSNSNTSDKPIKQSVNMGAKPEPKQAEQSKGYSFDKTEGEKTTSKPSLSSPDSGNKGGTSKPIKQSVNMGSSKSSSFSKAGSSSDVNTQQQMDSEKENLDTPENQDSSKTEADSNRKKIAAQQKRGSIINQNRNK